MTKRPTRWKAEVVDPDDNVHWEILVHDFPEPALRAALGTLGFRIRRADTPRLTGPDPLIYSPLDPAASIAAAHEYAARRETSRANVLMLLISCAPHWVSRERVRRSGGDSGDRRVHELRAMNWPIEIRQLAEGAPWSVRLNIPMLDDRPKLFDL